MKVNVKCFAMCREITGSDELTVELPASASVEQFWDKMTVLYPALEKYRAHSRIALNMEYVLPTATLGDGDEVCIIPPVSGG